LPDNVEDIRDDEADIVMDEADIVVDEGVEGNEARGCDPRFSDISCDAVKVGEDGGDGDAGGKCGISESLGVVLLGTCPVSIMGRKGAVSPAMKLGGPRLVIDSDCIPSLLGVARTGTRDVGVR
jgi:hypothetical protein